MRVLCFIILISIGLLYIEYDTGCDTENEPFQFNFHLFHEPTSMKQEILQPMAVYVLLLGCTPNIDWR